VSSGAPRIAEIFPIAFAIAIWLSGMVWPQILVFFGIHDYQTRFLDSYAVLAALDAVRAGADPTIVNPYDPLLRGHVYSDWWLGLRWLGLGREHNLPVAIVWIAAFAVTAYHTMRPHGWGEAMWLGLLLISPAMALVINRSNNDLVIFVLLAGCAAGVARAGWRGAMLAVACLALATGLKFYPVAAALSFLWFRPVRRMPAALLAALLFGMLVLGSLWSQVDRGRFVIGSGIYTMGAPLWWRDLGWSDTDAALPGVLLIILGAFVLARTRITTGLASRGETAMRCLAATGAIVILACFLAGMNYAYRWVFLLWPACWLWRQAADALLPTWRRGIAAFACGLIALAVWQDGVFCALVNSLPPRKLEWVNHAQMVFRLWTQPLLWVLMVMLAGWLLEAGLSTAREWWACRRDA
jgi:hypothetical protein